MTINLQGRLWQHQNKVFKGFSQTYNVCKLVYFEEMSEIFAALKREREISTWRREQKNRLVESTNPDWLGIDVF